MLYYYDEKICLNGWWDICFDGQWNNGKYLVPSVWNKSYRAVRKEGEKYFYRVNGNDSYMYEYLFDAFGYPKEWNRYEEAEVRRTYTLEKKDGKRYFLVFEGVASIFHLYVNGSYVGSQTDPSLPFIPDVTEQMVEGENEILLEIRNFVKIDDKKSIYPCGNEMLYEFRGVWQDVYLLERAHVFMEDITVRTSVRNMELTLTYVIQNTTDEPVECRVKAWIEEEKSFCIPDQSVMAKPGTTETSLCLPWGNPELWSPDHPKLYHLKLKLAGEILTERFGFREVWLEGPHLMLNGYPIHLFSDWGHKLTQFNHTRDWVQKWFDMLKDGNMNHSRLHTHPHPRFILDMADEQGILITGETAIHGSGGWQAGDSEEFWVNASKHVRNFVKRDKNHPCIVLWSAENEMRWNRDQTSLSKQQLPILRQLFNALDPTRAVCHEGDSSWWNEKDQPMLSRHYGKECTGMGWWDKKKPLHSGELAIYHYAGPNNTMHILGDCVWEDYANIDKASAIDLAWSIEEARVNGVICLGPWNMSCLTNLRPSEELVKLTYEDYSCPGVKPLQVMPGASEFEFWKEGIGYFPQQSFFIQAHAFRPFAVIDTDRQTQYFAGSRVQRTLNFINDTAQEQSGTAEIRFGSFIKREDIRIKRGESLTLSFELLLGQTGELEYSVEFNGENQLRRIILVSVNERIAARKRIGLYGTNRLNPVFLKEQKQGMEGSFTVIDKISPDYDMIIIGKNTVKEGCSLNREVQEYLQGGGRVLLLEQEVSLFPKIELRSKPVIKAFIRDSASPVLHGITEEELGFWGNSPYTLLSGDSYVAEFLYEKGNGENGFPILDSGDGGFGHGDMDHAAIFEAEEGSGLIVACQIRISDKVDAIPAARKLLQNMINYLENWEPVDREVLVTDKLETALSFKGAVVLEATEEVLEHFQLQKVIDTEGIWQGIKKRDIRWLNNDDLCGIETFTYSPAEARNIQVADFAFSGNAEALIVTPTKSALKELFVFNGKTEPLRAYTATKYCYYGQREENMLVARIGNLYITSIQARGRTKFQRVLNYLLKGLGKKSTKSILEGAIIKRGESKGYAQRVYLCSREVDERTLEEMVESTTYQTERMNPSVILDMAPFERVLCEEGYVNSPDSLQTFIFYTIESSVVRKDIGSNLGVPNPDALTFMELQGQGKVRVWINSKFISELNLEGEATLSDLELERGYNQVLIEWKARSKEDRLKTYWRNISRKAETGLKFI